EEGVFICILAPSGRANTTVLSFFAGLLDPIVGIVFLDGQPITTKTSSMGYKFPQDYLFPWKTIQENIMPGLHIRKIYDE
ncbi:spermidine/putrescine ABC transporter ATP-binding protein, partial [Bacillus cereus]|nr:spermidine/putrescine ABC transporter ATP-binding protein [Bacillus cereus]